MKILHFVYDHPRNPWCGGGGAGRTWAVNHILSQRHDITVLCGPFPGAATQEDPFKVRFLGKAERYAESRLRFMLESRKVNIRPYDLVVEEFSYYAPLLSRLSGRPLVTILQGRHGLSALRYRGGYGLLSLMSEYLILPRRRFVIVVSEHLRAAVHPKARVAVIGQGADIPRGLPPSKEDYVLFLGRLDVWHKGLDTLIQAWTGLGPNNRPMPLVIAGGGDQERVESMIRGAGGADIQLLGRLDHDQAMGVLNHAAFVCMPSRMEGSPLVLYEAFTLGKPVIGSSIPALSPLIEEGVTGIQVPPENPSALAHAIRTLLGDHELRKRMSEAALVRARDFHWEEVARRQEDFYREAVLSFSP